VGFRIRVARSPRTGRTFPLVRPSCEALQHLRTVIKGLTGRDRAPLPDAGVRGQSRGSGVGRLLSLPQLQS